MFRILVLSLLVLGSLQSMARIKPNGVTLANSSNPCGDDEVLSYYLCTAKDEAGITPDAKLFEYSGAIEISEEYQTWAEMKEYDGLQVRCEKTKHFNCGG